MERGIQEKMSQEPQARPPERANQEEKRCTLPKKETGRRGVGRIDREHPLGGEMSDILRGILERARLPWLLAHYSHVAVLALFSFINGCLSIGLMSALAVLTHSPFVFPSLGPTAFLFFYTPTAPSACPRDTLIGHAVGIAAGYLSLVVTGLTMAGPALSVGVTWPRVIAAALSLGLTAGVMVRLACAAPACGSDHADHLSWPLDTSLATDLTHGGGGAADAASARHQSACWHSVSAVEAISPVN